MTEPWQDKTIVIVDDSKPSRDQLEKLYTSMGLKVLKTLESGLAALEVIPHVNPDFVSLDIIMPEMDGIECYFKLRDLELPCDVFLVSALSLESRVVGVYADEIPQAAFLPKPLTEEVLRHYFEGLYNGEHKIKAKEDKESDSAKEE